EPSNEYIDDDDYDDDIVVTTTTTTTTTTTAATAGPTDRPVAQEIHTKAVYTCSKGSYFDYFERISTTDSNQRIHCNGLFFERHNYTLFGFRNNAKIVLKVVNAYGFLKDVNGSESSTDIGVISGGKCAGAMILKQEANRALSGSCDSPDGVTRVLSRRSDALYAIRGERCGSTCLGHNSVEYWPGKSFRSDN
ncbi:unnamed protein product, partial [Medioppia subpectinata]